MGFAVRLARAAPAILLLIAAAIVLSTGFGHATDGSDLTGAAESSVAQAPSIQDPDGPTAVEFCAALCATAGSATPALEAAPLTDQHVNVVRPEPSRLPRSGAARRAASPAPGLLGVLRL